jgi:hypothetical protein
MRPVVNTSQRLDLHVPHTQHTTSDWSAPACLNVSCRLFLVMCLYVNVSVMSACVPCKFVFMLCVPVYVVSLYLCYACLCTL